MFMVNVLKLNDFKWDWGNAKKFLNQWFFFVYFRFVDIIRISIL